MDKPSRSRSAKPQRGNPHRLSYRQHFFPALSISRFDRDGYVDLYDVVRRIRRPAEDNDNIFCADRSWNHGAETGYMRRYEDAFQNLVPALLSRRACAPADSMTSIISDFYALWKARSKHRRLTSQYLKVCEENVWPNEDTCDRLEVLEKNGYMAMRPDGSLAMRDVMSGEIFLAIRREKEALAASSWGMVETSEGEFCVPDAPQHGILPLTPSLALIANGPTGRITRENLGLINRVLFEHCQEFIFARDLEACPGLPEKLW